MNSVVWIYLAACSSLIWAKPSLPPLPVNPGGIGGLFRGPNLETIIRGPDGSEITSEQLGGSVSTEARLEPIVVPDQIAVSSVPITPIETAPVVVGTPSPIHPAVSIGIQEQQVSAGLPTPIAIVPREPSLAIAAPVVTAVPINKDPHIIETELVDAPEIEPDTSSDLKGPSGTISVRGSSSIVSGPASTTISEPVRKIPIAPIPLQPIASQPQPIAIQAQPIAIQQQQIAIQPQTIAIQPQPIAIQPQSISREVPVPATILTPPAPLNIIGSAQSTASTPLISLTGTSGAGIADAAVQTNLIPVPPPILQTPIITAERSNQLATGINSYSGVRSNQQLPGIDSLNGQQTINLGQTVVSTTTSSPIPASAEIDVSRINLGQTNPLQTIALSANAVSSTAVPLLEQNIGSSTAVPLSSLSPAVNAPSILDGSASNLNLASRLNQALVTNQVVSSTPGYTAVDSRDVISPSQVPILVNQPIVPSTALPPLAVNDRNSHLPPVSSVLDTVLVQPTDPRNREIIEFGGRQLENVGNIVPVLRSPVLISGNVNDIQQIPTASISQLTANNELTANLNGRYGRDTKKDDVKK